MFSGFGPYGPPDRQNPDPSKFFMVLLEVEPEVALQQRRNAVSCICVRAMRSQSYLNSTGVSISLAWVIYSAVDVAVIEDTGWASACMSCRIAHMAHLSKLTSRFLISIGPFAKIRGGSSAMQAFAVVCAAMVASTVLQHTALRGVIESERIARLHRVWYKNRYLVS